MTRWGVIVVPPDEPQPAKLDYAPRPAPLATRIRRWQSVGEDTFLGSSALTVAVLAVMSLVSIPLDRGFALTCLGVPLCCIATVLGIAGLFQRNASKTFPLVSLLLVCFYAFALMSLIR